MSQATAQYCRVSYTASSFYKRACIIAVVLTKKKLFKYKRDEKHQKGVEKFVPERFRLSTFFRCEMVEINDDKKEYRFRSLDPRSDVDKIKEDYFGQR